MGEEKLTKEELDELKRRGTERLRRGRGGGITFPSRKSVTLLIAANTLNLVL